MTEIDTDSVVIYSVALNDHPLVVGDEDERTDEELIAAVEERTTVHDGLDFPGWAVFVSDPPHRDRLRYVNLQERINVRVRYDQMEPHHKTERDVFDVVADHLDIEGFDVDGAAMSCPGAAHDDDFALSSRSVSIDLTG